MAVGAQQDRRCRPVGADGANQSAQEAADFRALGTFGGPQHGGDEPRPRRRTRRWAETRIIARVEAGADGTDTRFIVTSLPSRNARVLYEAVYCRRGAAENHIKAWKTHLAADRTSCSKATANQFRLFLHAGAYWLLWSLRALMPKRSLWRVAQFDTLRLRLIKIAARVVELKTMIRLHLPTACPYQAILRVVLGRIPRLVT